MHLFFFEIRKLNFFQISSRFFSCLLAFIENFPLACWLCLNLSAINDNQQVDDPGFFLDMSGG